MIHNDCYAKYLIHLHELYHFMYTGTDGASSDQQMQLPSTPEKSPLLASKRQLPTGALGKDLELPVF